MSVFQIHVLENETNILSSTCWNYLWTLWSHLLLPSPGWQQAPLRQPAEILSASLDCLDCRTQRKSRSSHSSGLQKPSWGQRVEYKTGGWRDIFGPKWTLFLKATADAVAVEQGRDKAPPREKVTPSLLWQTQLPSYQGQGSSDAGSSHHLPSYMLLYCLCICAGSLFSLRLPLGEGWGCGSVCTPQWMIGLQQQA